MDKVEFTGKCDFCNLPVEFARITHDGGFWSLAAIAENAGSDYLAIWCADCGPKHRADNPFFSGVSA